MAMPLFNARLRQLHKKRAAHEWLRHSFLFDTVRANLSERLLDIARNFPTTLLYNDVMGGLLEALGRKKTPPSCIIHGHMDFELARLSHNTSSIVFDENAWPFGENHFDLIVSILAHHWLNDPFHSFQVIRHSLKEDGLMMAAFFGEHTLVDLREALLKTEEALKGGSSPRTIPFMSMDKISQVLHAIGYKDVVVDHEILTVSYSDLQTLLHDLRGMGETNALHLQNKIPLPKKFFERLAVEYPQNQEGLYLAQFEIIYFAGWR